MRKNSVAVMDIRSSEITVAVGEHGVNGTFIVKSKYTTSYEGYADGELLDVRSFERAIKESVSSLLSSQIKKIKMFYVGIPDEFIKVVTTDKIINFASPKTISRGDVSALLEISKPKVADNYYFIRSGCQYYVLSDKRRVVEPIGCVTDSLRGILCFYYCDTAFARCLVTAFKKFGIINQIKFIPSCHAQANYLLPTHVRDNSAAVFDLGQVSSSYNVYCGNGVVYSRSFSIGLWHVAYYVAEECELSFEIALEFLKKINLNSVTGFATVLECEVAGTTYKLGHERLKDCICEGLDWICQAIETCIAGYSGGNSNNRMIYATGECVTSVRGVIDHISRRLVRNIELVAPSLPYYDKPKYSSFFSLLEMSLQDNKNKSLFIKQDGLTEVKNV